MRAIILTRGMEAIVDDADYEWLSKHNWHASPAGRKTKYWYAYRNCSGRSPLSMHREIMGNPEGMLVDHINGNTLDNRRENLRLCTKSDNKRNSRKCTREHKGKKYKGIGFDGRCSEGTYWAAVYVNGKKIYKTNKFRAPEEAARAYDELATEHYGEFANLNFPLSRSNDESSK
jgi:HNH endonuclease